MSPSGARENSGSLTGLSVVLAEDEPNQRLLMERILRSLDPDSLFVVENGQQALEMFQDGTEIDLLVTDLQMPVMDGVELLRHLGERKTEASIVLISAVSSEILKAAERIAGAHHLDIIGTIEKPMKKQEMRELAAIAGSHRGRVSSTATSAAPALLDEHAIRAAMAEKRVVPFLQPKLDLATGELAGAEALARMRGVDGSTIGPGAFIPIVETDPILATEFTLEIAGQVSSILANWQDPTRPKSISINLPADCLSDPSVVEQLVATIQAMEAPTQSITWEVTETAAIANFAVALEVLTRLRMMGYGLSLDDYGTGHSSLERLAAIPFTEVKIDRSFVRGCVTTASIRKILSSAIRLTKDLGMSCVAEGAETDEEVQVLRELGCDVVQGFAIAKPMPIDEFKIWAQSPHISKP